MQNNKSPGSTGFTTEFFKFFWSDISYFVVNSINYGFENKHMSQTQKEGIITCIPKVGKSRKYIKNWRPISLLNITYKIASGSIANRLKRILPTVIDIDQSGFISNRFTGDNLRLIYDVLTYSQQQQQKGLLVLIDFEKAFDTVAWSFIEKCLNFYNFKNDIIQWIKAFYTDIKSTVIVNNEPTPWFEIKRGCRQGDPISPYIFLLCGEILAHMIRQNDNIKGYSVNEQEVKISQYADDTSLFLDGSAESFEYCIHTVLEYAKYSGLAMNYEKTKVIWFGCKRTPTDIFLPEMNFQWNPTSFNILGVDFTVDLKNITDINIEKKLIDMQREINKWSKRDLTPFGKVTVIKTLIISKIVHIFISLPSPSPKMFKKINAMLYEFLWDGKPDKMKRSIARNKIELGGIGMIDVEIFDKALKLTWIRRFLLCKSRWKDIVIQLFPGITKIDKLGDRFIQNLSKTIKNNFWANVMTYFSTFHKKFKIDCLEAMYQSSFLFNEKIKIGNSVISNKLLERNNIFYIQDLMQNNVFLDHHDFILLKNVNIDFLTYNSIISAIKKSTQFKDLEKSNITFKHQPAIDNILKSKKGAVLIYRSLLDTSLECKGKTKWMTSVDIEEEEWQCAFPFLKYTTKDTKLRWLQLRILHNILTTNRSVAKYKENQSDLCTFCKKHSETIEHLFFDCGIVSNFWNDLTSLINRRCKHAYHLKFDKKLILFGQSQFISTDKICDLIILMAKFYIYRCKVQGTLVQSKTFIHELHNRYCIEKKMAKNKQQVMNNWIPYEDLFKSLL